MPKEFLVTFHLTKGQIQQTICEQSLSVLQSNLNKDILNKNINYLDINGTILFTRHIKGFTVIEIN
ncbi:TPA: hypothetical protein QCY18_003618 [Bacillus cereus]|uniref:hypothetical protein n=1 Tax=Bacillus TaxID=1386 RepID=UPI00084619FA|nr:MULTISPECIES: hypothetical protein [Bacillus]MED2680490.1 hypothetical protein [Bacillus thuringiensis]ASI79566.1 hypothetical protein BA202_20720 [Bacillus cereus]MCC2484878.1 hypothetical protein [Bacillus pacificus]MDA1605202.1 hypothetical protein [Bacillus cereus group sp. TH208-1LC]MEB9078805.1 hypothetical protein [Bacillus cereus]